MLTVDFDRLGLAPGERALDMGCGAGRHAFEMYRRGGRVTAFDLDQAELDGVQTMLDAMEAERQVPDAATARTVQGDAAALPFADGEFDRVVASEVLEHIPDADPAIAELVRVLRPGGTMAVTVPRWLPERVCWALSEDYHSNPGGHVRIFREAALRRRLEAAGLVATGRGHAHALHAPYWWLRCAVGVDREDHPVVRAYHRLLVWDMMSRPRTTRLAERVLDPLVGKSLVLYLRKPA